MKTCLVVTTINKPNKNIRAFSKGSKDKKWDFIVIGDKKSPKNFKLNYGLYFSLKDQIKIRGKSVWLLTRPRSGDRPRKNVDFACFVVN